MLPLLPRITYPNPTGSYDYHESIQRNSWDRFDQPRRRWRQDSCGRHVVGMITIARKMFREDSFFREVNRTG
jgi:hypothetical protein